MPITTHAGPLRVELPHEPEVTGLHATSYAKCEIVGPIHKTRLKARIGRLPLAGWSAIEAGLCRVMGLPD